MTRQSLIAGALALALLSAPVLAQSNSGTSPLSGGKGGTGNAFMQFSGPASSIKTYTLPNASGTIDLLNAVQTFTAAKTFADATLLLAGSSSGTTTLKAAATASGTWTFPAVTDTIVGRSTTDTLTNKTLTTPVLSSATPTAAGAIGYGAFPNYGDGSSNHALVDVDRAQTLTNKTIGGASNTLTVRLGSDVTGTLPKANGGLGASTLSGAMDTEFGSTRGSVLYRGASGWVALGPGSSGQLLSSGGAGADPSWITASGTGTVTSVTCGTGLSGGTITASGTCNINLSSVTSVLGSNVALNNTANYFTGPSVAQGTSGTWFASGTVTVSDSSASAAFYCKLWDGTTVIASASAYSGTGTQRVAIALSGVLASPAGNIRISCRDVTTTNGSMEFNVTGNSKDSVLTAIRIQ